MNLEGHTHKLYELLVDIDIIMRVIYKKNYLPDNMQFNALISSILSTFSSKI